MGSSLSLFVPRYLYFKSLIGLALIHLVSAESGLAWAQQVLSPLIFAAPVAPQENSPSQVKTAEQSEPANFDRVELRQGVTNSTKVDLWNPLKTIVLIGKIDSIDAKSLVMQVRGPDGNLQRKSLPAEQVQQIWPAWDESLQTLVDALQRQDVAAYLQALDKVNLPEVPDWQAKLVMTRIIQLRASQRQFAQAGDSFIRLAGENAIPQIFYADMPLCWIPGTADEVQPKARQWIKQDSDVAKLLGASWLLLGADSSEAQKVVVELGKSSNPAIAQLAKAQSWRLVTAPETLQALPAWTREIDRMLTPLAVGPTEFVVDRLMRIEEYELAFGYAARIVSQNRENTVKNGRALKNMTDILKRQGREQELEKLTQWIQKLDGTR